MSQTSLEIVTEQRDLMAQEIQQLHALVAGAVRAHIEDVEIAKYCLVTCKMMLSDPIYYKEGGGYPSVIRMIDDATAFLERNPKFKSLIPLPKFFSEAEVQLLVDSLNSIVNELKEACDETAMRFGEVTGKVWAECVLVKIESALTAFTKTREK